MMDQAVKYPTIKPKNQMINMLTKHSKPFFPNISELQVKTTVTSMRWKLMKIQDVIKTLRVREGKRRRQWWKRHTKRSIKFILSPPDVKYQKPKDLRIEFWTLICDLRKVKELKLKLKAVSNTSYVCKLKGCPLRQSRHLFGHAGAKKFIKKARSEDFRNNLIKKRSGDSQNRMVKTRSGDSRGKNLIRPNGYLNLKN